MLSKGEIFQITDTMYLSRTLESGGWNGGRSPVIVQYCCILQVVKMLIKAWLGFCSMVHGRLV